LQCVAAHASASSYGIHVNVTCGSVCCCACCSVLQCVAMCCNVLQCVAVCCSVLPRAPALRHMESAPLQHNATHCITVLQHRPLCREESSDHCNTLQHSTATQHCNTALQHSTATHCNTALQHRSLCKEGASGHAVCCNAANCGVLRCVAVCCGVLRCVAVTIVQGGRQRPGSRSSKTQSIFFLNISILVFVFFCGCNVLQCVAVCCKDPVDFLLEHFDLGIRGFLQSHVSRVMSHI